MFAINGTVDDCDILFENFSSSAGAIVFSQPITNSSITFRNVNLSAVAFEQQAALIRFNGSLSGMRAMHFENILVSGVNDVNQSRVRDNVLNLRGARNGRTVDPLDDDRSLAFLNGLAVIRFEESIFELQKSFTAINIVMFNESSTENINNNNNIINNHNNKFVRSSFFSNFTLIDFRATIRSIQTAPSVIFKNLVVAGINFAHPIDDLTGVKMRVALVNLGTRFPDFAPSTTMGMVVVEDCRLTIITALDAGFGVE